MNIKNIIALNLLSVYLVGCAEPAIDAPNHSRDASGSSRLGDNQLIEQGDASGSSSSRQATSSIYITSSTINYDPVVSNELFFVAENSVLNNVSLLANDTDPNGDFLSIASINNSQAGGIVEQLDRDVFKYTPPANYNGIDNFTYLVSDGLGGQAYGKAEIVVYSVPKPNVDAKADNFDVPQSTAVELNIMQNDIINFANYKGISISSYPRYGSLFLYGNGIAQYIPMNNYTGQDSFTYQLEDTQNNISSATVSLNIKCKINCSRTFALQWKPSASQGVVGYKVYVGRQYGQYSEVFQTDINTQYEYTANNKGVYYFAVSAINNRNIESELSEVIWGSF